jgi:pullulanase
MRKWFLLAGLMAQQMLATAQQPIDFSSYPVYKGKDLGLTYTTRSSTFKIWSPPATAAKLFIYQKDAGGNAMRSISLVKNAMGVWSANVKGDWKNYYYTFQVLVNGKWLQQVPDPYAKAVGTNGQRAMVLDLKTTNPPGWEKDKSPALAQKTDAIIYELHVRDASIAANSGIQEKGKFLGLAEAGTTNGNGLSTGLDHLKELGITHVQLLPVFDFQSVDEKNPNASYNWGYDPLNYNTPEGSYASNAADGAVRIREFKQLVQTLHQNGLRVIMDVVYNHTALTENSNFNQLVPGYYYRQDQQTGKFSNASACGNETASERAMFQQFMLASMQFWIQEYHIDGFRMDLMGIHDINTINLIAQELHKIKPDVLLFGEGWTGGASPLPDSERALKANAARLDRVGVFSDDIRDAIKGSVFDHEDNGFASGKTTVDESVKFGIVAACQHPQVEYAKVNYSKAPYAAQPYHTITYCECHDNHVLWDRLSNSANKATVEEREQMHRLALSIVLTSQGISFLHAGAEFLRTKQNVENSYQSPDRINAIDWTLKTKNKAVFDFVKGMISLRKQHPAFRLPTQKQIAELIRFQPGTAPGVIHYIIDGEKAGDSWKKIAVLLNGKNEEEKVALTGHWKVVMQGNNFKNGESQTGSIVLPKHSCTILYQ